MNDDKSNTYDTISLVMDAFAATAPSLGAVKAECADYLDFIHTHKGFEQVTIIDTDVWHGYGVFIKEEVLVETLVTHKAPQLLPTDLFNRVTHTVKEDYAKKRETGHLRRLFGLHALELIAKNGSDPHTDDERFVLDYMLQGAMKDYDGKKPLAVNVLHFMMNGEGRDLKAKSARNSKAGCLRAKHD